MGTRNMPGGGRVARGMRALAVAVLFAGMAGPGAAQEGAETALPAAADLPAPSELGLSATRAALPDPAELRLEAAREALPPPRELGLTADRAALPDPVELSFRATRQALPDPADLRLGATRLALPDPVDLGLRAERAALPPPYRLTLRAERLEEEEAEPVTVPAVVGLPLPMAKGRLSNAGLTAVPVLGAPADDRHETPGRVFSASPPPGATVSAGSEVSLRVYAPRPKVTVPDLSGETLEAARGRLTAAGFDPAGPALGKAPEAGAGEPGTVIGTRPPAGATLPKFSPVTILLHPPRPEAPPVADPAPPPAPEPEEPAAEVAWEGAWRGTVQLSEIRLDGARVSPAQFRNRLESGWRRAKATGNRQIMGSDLAENIGDAIVAIVSAAVTGLEQGLPFGLALAPEGDDFRFVAPRGPGAEDANERLAGLSSLTRLGEGRLRFLHETAEEGQTMTVEIELAPAPEDGGIVMHLRADLRQASGESWLRARRIEFAVVGQLDRGRLPFDEMRETILQELQPHMKAAAGRL
ncbi:PASTA domain-containing protein [Roseovarius salinarum]|uniref:PASTA domain-containing protein n=1 Tax=Roseovarius salinarum TaxID=1981892 RepID=UPI000C3291B1|nr:PASTA domain-containing protein [Roseovarius salinarum]